ncbi:hypothetical protein OG365_07165 [Streptomyces sp. NBC_00853]|uniref:hypothetical protein n=1 Tax=Streptomyces sp. NBC_00853 TaxID=2903681 RepID=UPI003873475F|nr:hypothetical protein OG365_07165 [Streptomyces sp. NBC_00853]
MQPDDAYHLDRLARRVDGPGPIHVIDPGSDNWLSAGQGSGRVMLSALDEWERDASVIFPPALLDWDLLRISLPVSGGNMRVQYKRPDRTGYPVAPGMQLAFWVPGMVGVAAEWRYYFLSPSGASLLSVGSGNAKSDRPFIATVPEGAAYAVPVMWFGRTFVDLPLSGAVLREARPEDLTARAVKRQMFSTSMQAGTGPVTDYTATAGVTLSVSVGKALLTSTGAAGAAVSFGGAKSFAVTPGEIVNLTHAVPATITSTLVWADSAGTVVGQSRDTSIGRVPTGAAYVWPKVEVGAVATATAIGAASLEITAAPSVPPGEGMSPYSITGYSQTSAAGSAEQRSVSLELVEVAQ